MVRRSIRRKSIFRPSFWRLWKVLEAEHEDILFEFGFFADVLLWVDLKFLPRWRMQEQDGMALEALAETGGRKRRSCSAVELKMDF